MANKAVSPTTFSLAQARGIVKDLFTPNPVIYWADFLLSAAGGGIGFVLTRRVFAPFSVPQLIAFVAGTPVTAVASYKRGVADPDREPWPRGPPA